MVPLILADQSKRQEDLWVCSQPDIQSEFQKNEGYTEKTGGGGTAMTLFSKSFFFHSELIFTDVYTEALWTADHIHAIGIRTQYTTQLSWWLFVIQILFLIGYRQDI